MAPMTASIVSGLVRSAAIVVDVVIGRIVCATAIRPRACRNRQQVLRAGARADPNRGSIDPLDRATRAGLNG